jgi:hypothetical protein
MKKINIVEFMKKADFVLVFILAILGIVSLVVSLISNYFPFPRHRSEPQMPYVVDEKVEIKEYVEFDKKIKDVYVFAVKSSGVRAEDSSAFAKEYSASYFNSLGKSMGDDGITNFVFVKPGKGEQKLFSKNVYIYKHHFLFEAERENLMYAPDCNVYAVVKSDTNNDKFVDSKDDVSLFVSDYDGTNLMEISSSIVEFESIDRNHFMFSEYDGKTLSYYVYDCDAHKKNVLKTVEQDISEKKIALY